MKVRPLLLAAGILGLLGTPAHVLAQAPAATPFRPAQAAQNAQPPAIQQIQGFHVVLVVGEIQRATAPAEQELPEGAARALNDMREFLPYKHYRVLDAQWSSCCSGPVSKISGRLQGVLGVPGPNGATNLVHRPYVFEITARASSLGIQTRFVLAAQDARSAHSADDRGEAERVLKNLQSDLATMEIRVQETRKRVDAGVASALELREMEDRFTQLKREAEGLQARMDRTAAAGDTIVMDSSFTMDAGETVVVGTSKLGGDKALIAVVTAVRRR